MFRRLAILLVLAPLTAWSEEPLPKSDLDKLLASTDEIAKSVSDGRQLPIKRPIARGVMSKPEVLKRLVARIDDDFKPAEIAAEEKAMKMLGLLPADLDYRKTVLELLTEQVAGFYDPQVRELYIADWISVGLQRMVMAHEIGHALQDQSFDLLAFTKPNRENGDEILARHALVEGDGVALMIEFMFKEMGLKNDPWADDTIANTIGATASSGLAGGELFDKSPLVLKETLLFPYRDGLRFVGRARRTRPWSDIDAMYAKPPVSTEQILHPQKYRDGEKPVALKTPPLPSLKGWERPYTNVIGELVFGVLLQQHGLAKDVAERAAAGWGADRVIVFEPAGGEAVLIDYSAWDTEMDAIEASDALTKAMPVALVERRGKVVLLMVGHQTAPPRLRQEIWAKWKAA